jgi:hypothetical protein
MHRISGIFMSSIRLDSRFALPDIRLDPDIENSRISGQIEETTSTHKV